MFLKIISYLIVLLFAAHSQSQTPECLDWFLISGLAAKTTDCELKCAITPVDMSTFSCSAICEELDSTQSSQEKKMDLANNEKGISFFSEKQKSGKSLELVDIEREALSLLRQKKLSVLNSRFETIPGGYYSK